MQDKDKIIVELKAENERLKQQLAEIGKSWGEIQRLREHYIKLSQQKDLDNAKWQKRCTDLHVEDKAKADKYWLVLQKIKKYIAKICKEECGYVQKKRCSDCDCRYGAILDLITKAEEE